MPQITFIQHNGSKQVVDADNDQSLMQAALAAGVPGIVAECTGSCSCATCHVYVDKEWGEITGSPSEAEEDMLDFAVDVRDNSRLSCQIQLTDAMDGMTIRVPARQF
jgi:2Fe-2S ferredoxin